MSLEFGRTSILPDPGSSAVTPRPCGFGLSAHFVDDWRQHLARFRGGRRVGRFRNRRKPCAAGPHWLAGTLQASQSPPEQVTFGFNKAKGGRGLNVAHSSPCCQAKYPLLGLAPKRQAANRAYPIGNEAQSTKILVAKFRSRASIKTSIETRNNLREVTGVSTIKLTVNGKTVSAEVEDRTLLVNLLRDHLNLTGTHIGCDTSQCGACVVHIDGRAVKSCTVLVGQANGANVTTIEGIAKVDELHPMQAAFRDNHGLQCGYCTPGMIMSAIDIVHRYAGRLDEETIRQELEGNICRCTGYHNIVKSVLDAAGRMKVAQAAE
jgi:aerobic carbon-monoxide dehydrogenase small subunit